AFPYKSAVTGMNSKEMTEGYEKASGRQVTQQMGSSMAVFDAGIAALKATPNPLDKAALAKSISTLKTTTIVGEVDFNTGPMPHVIPTTRFRGTQYLQTNPRRQCKLER